MFLTFIKVKTLTKCIFKNSLVIMLVVPTFEAKFLVALVEFWFINYYKILYNI